MPSVKEVEQRFLQESWVDRAVVVKVAAWAATPDDDEVDDGDVEASDDERTGPVDGGDTAVAVFNGRLISIYNRHLHRGDEVVEVTLSVGFGYPEELKLHEPKFASLRKRLAVGYCATIAEPYLSSVARQVADALGPIITVPRVKYSGINDLGLLDD